MKNVYQFDLKKILIDYLHRLDIRPKRVAWLYACLSVLKQVHNEFLVCITDGEKKLSLLPQMMVIEKYLKNQYHSAIYLEENMSLREVRVHIPTRARYKSGDIVVFVKNHSHIGTKVSIHEFFLNET